MSIDVIKLAREIADKDKVDPFVNGFFILTPDELSRFAARHRALVLEEAAKVCDVTPPYPFRPSIEAAHAIRALKPQE